MNPSRIPPAGWIAGLLAGACSAALDHDLRVALGSVTPVWLPSLLGLLVLRRWQLGGLLVLLASAAVARLWLSTGAGAGAWLLPAAHLLAETVVTAWLGSRLRQRLPSGLPDPRALARLAFSALSPVLILAGCVQGLAQAYALDPQASVPAYAHWSLQFILAQSLAVTLAYLVQVAEPVAFAAAQRRLHVLALAVLVVLASVASLHTPLAWLATIALLAWLGARCELRGLVFGIALLALLPGMARLMHPELPVAAGLQWNLWFSASVAVLLALALESLHRDAGRSQMSLLVRARTEVLQAELARRRDIEERHRDCPQYDGLTGMPNRALLLDRLGQAIADSQRQQTGLAVACLALDGLQVINDSAGRQAGDRALAECARRLRPILRVSDTLARVGAADFVILAQRAPTPSAAAEVAMRVLAAFESPLLEDAPSLAVGASLGLALYPLHGETPEQLLRMADDALAEVRRQGSSGWMLHAGRAVADDSADDREEGAPGGPDQTSGSM